MSIGTRQKLSYVLAAVVMHFSISGVAAEAAEKVKIGAAVSWPAYAYWSIIQKQKLAPDLDIEVSILNDPLMGHSMLASGQMDVYNTTPDYGPIAAERKFPYKIVAMTSVSRGVDQIVFAPGIELSSLKGKKVAAPQAFVGHLVMGAWLASNGIAAGDVEWANLDGDAAASALIGGSVAAAYSYEPWTSKMLESLKGAKVVASSADPFFLKHAFVGDSIFMSDEFLSKRRETATKLMQAYWKAVAWYKANPAEGNKIISENLQWPLADTESILGKDGSFNDVPFYVFTFAESAKFCGVMDGELPYGITNGQLPRAQKVTSDGWKALGLVKSDTGTIVDCGLMKELVGSGFKAE